MPAHRPPGWEHFAHPADLGIRGVGRTPAEAFEQAGVALTAVVCDPGTVRETGSVSLACEAQDIELLFVEWIDAIVYAMTTRRMLFRRYRVEIEGRRLTATLWGEPIDLRRHEPAVEVKGATLTELRVARAADGSWCAQCVVDV